MSLSRKRLNGLEETINKHQMLFGINQGCTYEDLRIEHHTESAYVIEQEMTALGYTCITLSTGRRMRKRRITSHPGQRRVDGAILMGSMFETEAVKKSIEEHLPDIPVAL